ncbi:phosphoribosylaminoimidazole-succinocarboxamide synthase [Haloarcula hispanica N601]|uniref:phosphoribosylaminoimidazolesuccinocarboxamide synthase n=3 Tax=Haloarcula hispanica TaxID=51589 RepID=V5TKB8_HALHI|nr:MULTISPECIES: phosphoribosylaminoimidazolesuccinocarboxamide synthase [Haloarcula]AEM56142.1 phosphoribosylaminoimidazole-succinocarboxamide synthase [Haloarcula hispanica ATCC 33960]AHB64954.1 phosphoribosylaminoimidazole-succinocarboxamide synthase [Haloarcula hispanica N601]AJF26120.1 phosphoribosylaminoimidazole-succinocarboxamide synthase [Haloarcula sp. CBA1115]KZX49559.1 phosphoribosylaminoimidazolesuccinocarboxamide synthase [Haloarcula sp. K1]
MTSVKEFRVDEPATAEDLGRGAFVFTDDYSVFDWGKMPDRIPDKGASLCTMGAYNFQLLEENHVPTHYEGVRLPDSDEVLDLGEALSADAAPEEMVIELTQVPDLPFEDGRYDYDAYHGAADENYLIPLEIVFRNRVGVGSSLRSRTEPADHGLDYDTWPEEVVDLDEPIVEFSTKYEEQDRYLDREAADRIAGTASIDRLEELARAVNHIVTQQAAEADLVHEDGKIECLYYDGEIRVADVVGTFDENRFSYGGQQVSKEVIRQYHKRTQPEWVEAVSEAKEQADAESVADWKSLCAESPEPLDEDVIQVARDLYCAGTNAYIGGDVFDAPSLDEAVSAAGEL